MGKINTGRVILGGLLTGLIINIGEFVLNEPILGKEWTEVMQSFNRQPVGGSAIALFLAMGFALGIMLVWIYAAIRPRFGPGPKTAICAALIGWALCYLYPSVGQLALAIIPARLLVIGTAWGLVELPIATLIGARFYKES